MVCFKLYIVQFTRCKISLLSAKFCTACRFSFRKPTKVLSSESFSQHPVNFTKHHLPQPDLLLRFSQSHRSSLITISCKPTFVNNFFQFLKIIICMVPIPFGSSLIRILHSTPFVNSFFDFFRHKSSALQIQLLRVFISQCKKKKQRRHNSTLFLFFSTFIVPQILHMKRRTAFFLSQVFQRFLPLQTHRHLTAFDMHLRAAARFSGSHGRF